MGWPSRLLRAEPDGVLNPNATLGAEGAGYYSVDPLRKTLADLIDFGQVNDGPVRLTVGASRVTSSEMHYFDSRDTPLDLRHIMASGALPPAFPAVRIDGELYWDGGILSNTPVEVVFDDDPRRDLMVYAVHIWNPHGAEPATIQEVLNRQKDVQYSSRAGSHIKRQRQLHRLRHVITELSRAGAAGQAPIAQVASLAAYGCPTRMHVIRLLAPALIARITARISISARQASARAGTPAMPIRCARSKRRRGAARSIRSKALSCTKRWVARWSKHRPRAADPQRIETMHSR